MGAGAGRAGKARATSLVGAAKSAPLIRTAPGKDCRRGPGENRDVEPDRPVLDVVEVEPDEVVEAEIDPARHLPKACHPRQHEIALPVPRKELLVVADGKRPRADQRHLAPQDIQHLRQLVERETTQESPDGRYTRIVLDLEERTGGLVVSLERALAGGRVGVHRPELHHPERLLSEPDAPVAIEHRAARAELDRNGHREPERQAGDDDQARHDEVEAPLQRPFRSCERGRAQLEQRRALAGNVFGTLQEQLGGARRDLYLGSEAVRILDELEELALGEATIRHDELVDVVLPQDAWHRVEATQHAQVAGVATRSDRAEELVANPTAIGSERAPQSRQLFALADEHRPAS